MLKRIDCKPKSKPQHVPFPCPRITCGQKTQIATTDETAVLKPEEIRTMQSTDRVLLHFGRMIEDMTLVGTNYTAMQ